MNITDIEEEINQSIALCITAKSIETFCPFIAAEQPKIDPKTNLSSYHLKYSSINHEKYLLSRYAIRSFYHALNFIKQYKAAQNNVLSFKSNSSELNESMVFGTTVSDIIIFEFDAFLYSCKSILKIDLAKAISKKIHSSLSPFVIVGSSVV